MISYSVVVPVFNAEKTLKELSSGLTKVLSSLNKEYEIIFVDDRSIDQSWQIITELSKQNPSVKGIRLAKNYGQHNATICGFNNASGEFILTIDDDLQHSPESIKSLIEKQESTNSDVVYGVFDASQSSFRILVSKLWKFLAKNVNDGIGRGSSLRLFRKQVAKNIAAHKQQFVFIDEVIKWYTESIAFVKVPHYHRHSGKSAYTKRKLFNLTSDLIIFYSSLPLKLMTWTGLFFSLIFFLLGSFFLIKKIFFKINVPGFAALIVTLLFTTGIILFCLGILGEYIRRIYMVMNTVPNHSVAETTG